MTESQEIEEILMEAHAHNLRNEVMDLAKKHEHPLQCTMEKN